MIENFYKVSRQEIVVLLQDFLEKDLYLLFPEFRHTASVIVIGSVATGVYDMYSDIDLVLLFQDQKELEDYRPKIKEYKQHLKELGVPIQVHTPVTYTQVESSLADWQDDSLLREYSQALIVHDPEDRFRTLQQKFSYYPGDVYQEKVRWLFAEIIFQSKERLEIAVARKDEYFCEVIKVHLVRLFMNTVLLLHRQWPSFDKHLYQDFKKVATKDEVLLVTEFLFEKDVAKLSTFASQIKAYLETLLVEAKVIQKETDEYWIDARPKYQVKLG